MIVRILVLASLVAIAPSASANGLFDKLRGKPTSEATVDGRSAAADDSAGARLFARMTQSQIGFGLDVQQIETRTTPVAGMYEIVERSNGQLVTYTNESGSLYGDSRGFRVLQPTGDRPLTAEESAALRREMLARLDPSFLIRVTYGDGGSRQILLRSAIDCSGCKMMESMLATHASALNTTFLVLPSSLAPIDASDGPARWSQAAQILCAADAGRAWKTYWHDQSTPGPSVCRHDGEALATAARQFDDLTMATAERAGGVPRLYNETGGSVPAIQQEKHAEHLEAFYGPPGKPAAADAPRMSWLTTSP
jgi:hypothetical protein